ncbi:MAG: ABC transporter permease [Candidatus Pacebacteria bacterium]|nr:ABC transporter permease [Candidatus Paceibacterota bacterium]
MPLKHILITAIRGLRTHTSRSALTILGIVIGVAAIIIVMALGQGAQDLILSQVEGLGAETVVLRPGTGVSDITKTLFTQTLTQNDIAALEKKQNVPNLIEVSPLVIMYDAVEFQGKVYRPSIIGGSAEFLFGLLDISLQDGRYYTDDDIDQKARVAIIGATVKEELFENSQAVGQQIRIKDKKFKVLGVLEKSGQAGPFDMDELVMIPQTSAQTYITGTNYFNEVFLRADDPKNVEKMAYDIAVTLRETHDIGLNEDDDFDIQTQQNVIDQIETIVSVFTAFLVTVVSISLVVGGIGIMNIMLVSVFERTKEIGLRKALGATRNDILKQFLFEAVILTSIGGFVGVILGTVFSYVAAVVLAQTVAENWAFAFPVGGAILGVGVSASVGLIFGIYPANQASKKSPIEALRYE